VGLPALLVAGIGVGGYLAFAKPTLSHSAIAGPTLPPPLAAKAVSEPRTLDEMLAMPPEQLAQIDIARMNLLCAIGLPGAEGMDIDKCLGKLDAWAAHVKQETERHLYRLTDPRYKDHAEHYQHSEARFRAEWLVTVLQQDIGLHYHAGFVPQDVEVPPFKTSKETFIHGLMDNDDPPQGLRRQLRLAERLQHRS
jgi:hypothetical protein